MTYIKCSTVCQGKYAGAVTQLRLADWLVLFTAFVHVSARTDDLVVLKQALIPNTAWPIIYALAMLLAV